MLPKSLTSAVALSMLAIPAAADAPKVVTDIAPIQGLVARVMAGVGEPAVLVPPGATPHGYSLRPSNARELSNAEAVFWVGEALAPMVGGADHPIDRWRQCGRSPGRARHHASRLSAGGGVRSRGD